MQVERTFEVDRPIEEVFDYVADFENTNEWDPGTVETRRTAGDGGLGTTYANRSTFLGRTVELEYETVRHDRPTHVTCRGRNRSSTATDDLTLTAVGDRTRVHYRATFAFHGLVRFVAPLVVRPRLDGLADETVAQLKTALERQGRDRPRR